METSSQVQHISYPLLILLVLFENSVWVHGRYVRILPNKTCSELQYFLIRKQKLEYFMFTCCFEKKTLDWGGKTMIGWLV